jgi:NTP pyrophosphatase (non-canonical NTP hydrolase)
MDADVHLQELKDAVRLFCEAREWDRYHDAKELAIGISTEAAELLEHFRFKSREEIEAFFRDAKKREEIEEEMADVLYFLLRMAQRYDVDLTKALGRKLEKNEQRYPVEKAKGRNTKYTELR